MNTYNLIKGVTLTIKTDVLLHPKKINDHNTLIIAGQQGELSVKMNGNMHIVRCGDMLVLPANVLQEAQPSSDYKGFVLMAPEDTMSNVLYYCLQQDKDIYQKYQSIAHNPVIHLNERQQRLGHVFEELLSIYSNTESRYKDQIVLAFCQVIIFELLSWFDEHTRQEQMKNDSKLVNRQDTHFQKFLMLVQKEHGRNREVAWYANQLGLTPKYLAHICKEKSQKTPLTLINELCIFEIKQLLMNTNLSAKEIAFDMQFPNPSMFTKFFRTHTGLTPIAFRRQTKS